MAPSGGRTLPVVLTLLFAQLAFGQVNLERTFPIKHASNAREFEEFSRLIQYVMKESDVGIDTVDETLTVRGTADQLSLVEWIITELDHTVGQRPHSPGGIVPNYSEYRPPGGKDDVLRVFYLTQIARIQDLQEVATVFHEVAELRWAGTHMPRKALLVRGTADQVAVAEWLVNEWDDPMHWQPSGEGVPVRAFQAPDGSAETVRLFYLNSLAGFTELQIITTIVRTITDSRWVFALPKPGAVVFRGKRRNLEMAEWLFNQLNKTANWRSGPGVRGDWNQYEYLAVEYNNEVARVFPLPDSLDPTATLLSIRRKKWLPYTFICDLPRVFIFRGTPEDGALVEQWIGELIDAQTPQAAP